MNYESMVDCCGQDERLHYYADDVLGVARVIDEFRRSDDDHSGRGSDYFLRTMIHALNSIADSLEKEASAAREKHGSDNKEVIV